MSDLGLVFLGVCIVIAAAMFAPTNNQIVVGIGLWLAAGAPSIGWILFAAVAMVATVCITMFAIVKWG